MIKVIILSMVLMVQSIAIFGSTFDPVSENKSLDANTSDQIKLYNEVPISVEQVQPEIKQFEAPLPRLVKFFKSPTPKYCLGCIGNIIIGCPIATFIVCVGNSSRMAPEILRRCNWCCPFPSNNDE